MKCEDCRTLLTGHLRGDLDEGRRAAVEAHLATCAECATEAEGARRVLVLLERASEEPMAKVVNDLIERAVRERASDIHVQALSEHCVVRLRIDGVLRDVLELPATARELLVDRIKLMAGLSLAERRVAQDGRIQLRAADLDLDLRVSVVPGVLGESVVVRLLDRQVAIPTLDQLGIAGEPRRQLDELIHRPNGVVFVTGPTGSGKTTTLYAVLQELNKRSVHVMSVEDPVEVQIDGVTQIPVNVRSGMDFPACMKVCRRQDPDVILCGEVRDRETAEAVVALALTGHLVLSTLHTPDSITTMRRLIDVGVPRFLLSQALNGATAQVLARRMCQECRKQHPPTKAEVAWLHEAGVEDVPARIWRAGQTGACGCHLGHVGRMAFHEVFTLDEEIRRKLTDGDDLREIEELAASRRRSLTKNAAECVLSGEVSVEEAMRVTAFVPRYGKRAEG